MALKISSLDLLTDHFRPPAHEGCRVDQDAGHQSSQGKEEKEEETRFVSSGAPKRGPDCSDVRGHANSGEPSKQQLKRPRVQERPEDVHLRELPSCEAYERSYNHRDVVTHVCVTQTQFLITASADGIIKFWKKTTNGLAFVKNFKSHSGPIEDLSVTHSGGELASISRKDMSVKIFDIVNFDMINMFTLKFEPKCVLWLGTESSGSAYGENLIITDSNSANIYTFDSRQSNSEPKHIIDHIHSSSVCCMRLNSVHNFIVSADTSGLVKYWRAKEGSYDCLRHPNASGQHDSVIHDFTPAASTEDKSAKRVQLHSITFSPDGNHFATTSSDRKVRVFKFKSGKRVQTFDESLEATIELHKSAPFMNNMDFARKMSIEREIDKNQATCHEVALFDQSGHFLFYPTMFGVKVRNWRTGETVKSLGREETNFRPLCVALFQGLLFERQLRRFDAESLKSGVLDPTLYCTSYKKNRFYCFSNRFFDENKTEDERGELIKDRDIFNEMPTREEILAATEIEQMQQKISFENATIHTTLGDIHLKLFPLQAPKTCENFCTHSKNNYFNNHIFHRVIKQFMIQTGDPTGTGVGGESIWDDDFEDEFSDELKHDKPFVLSMANRGPNTNGSQFFITVAPCPSLDGKHTVFGRVTRGMDVCQKISKVKTDPKTDKPYEDIKIININVF